MITLINNIVIILFIKSSVSELFRCDYLYSGIVRGWMKYHVIPATWQDANLRCSLEGAILASPTTSDLVAYLKTRMAIYRPTPDDEFEIFTGVHATFSKGDYFTVDGVPLSQIPHQWRPNEPNNDGNIESCLSLDNKGLLGDISCGDTRPYFCFRPENASQEINRCGTVDPEYQYESRTGSCYKFHTVPRTFSRANFACTAEGGHLAIINGKIEASVIRDLFRQYPKNRMIGDFWKDVAYVGFSDWGERWDWRTIHGQTLSEAGYSIFAPGEPNNKQNGEFCGSVKRNAMLNDLDCDTPHAFICEKDPEYPPLCAAMDDESE